MIKDMSCRLPSELAADRLFRDRLNEILRGYAGVYTLYDGETPYYTGLTGNLFGRLRLSTPAENLTVPPIENLTDRRGDEPQVVVAS